jgi:hypothetical protein
MSFERTIAAALAETKNKFALAEALATEIPARRDWRAHGDDEVSAQLAEAREAIVAAGGEPRAVETLSAYRRTALWVRSDVTQLFNWVDGASFSAHDEARRFGISHEDFATSPKTVRQIRSDAKKASPDGGNVAKSWTPEQKVEAVRELLSDPEVSEQVSEEITDHVAEDPMLTEKVLRKRDDAPRSKPQRRVEIDYDEMIGRAVDWVTEALGAEGTGKWTPAATSEALLYFLAKALSDRKAPTGDNATLVNDKLADLFREVEEYANTEAS